MGVLKDSGAQIRLLRANIVSSLPYSAFYRYDPMESSLTVACFLRSVARLLLRQQLLNGICTLDTIYNLASTKRQAVSPRPVATNAYIWSHRAFIEAAVLGMRHVCSLHNDICTAFSHLLHDFERLSRALFLAILVLADLKAQRACTHAWHNSRGDLRRWDQLEACRSCDDSSEHRSGKRTPSCLKSRGRSASDGRPHTVPKHRLLSRNSYLVTSKTAKRRHFTDSHSLSHTRNGTLWVMHIYRIMYYGTVLHSDCGSNICNNIIIFNLKNRDDTYMCACARTHAHTHAHERKKTENIRFYGSKPERTRVLRMRAPFRAFERLSCLLALALSGRTEAGLLAKLLGNRPPPPPSPPPPPPPPPPPKSKIWVHVAVRTYTAQNIQVIGTIGSIYGAARHAGSWLILTAAVLNTGQDGDTGHSAINVTISSLATTLAAAHARTSGTITLRPTLHEAMDTYGYVSSDAELSRVMKMSDRPDYILFANGDTLYAQEIFQEAKLQLFGGAGIIGMDWQPTVRHKKSGEIKQCNFVHGGVDLNGMLFRVDTLRAAKASFGAMPTPCPQKGPRRCKAADGRPYWVADWGLAWQVIEYGGSAVCLSTPRPQFLQN